MRLVAIAMLCVLVHSAAGQRAGAQVGRPVHDGALAKEAKTAVGKALKFTVYKLPYFAKNTYEPNQAQSFAVLTSLKEFEAKFGVGMVMGGKQPEINAQTFESQIIVAVVRRGPMCDYTVESVIAKAHGIEVRYKVTDQPAAGATYAVPLILAVPKGPDALVTFIENGKEVKVLK